MSSNIGLLKKNGELIEKYYNKLTNEVRRLTDEPIDDTAIERCNSEMLSILNEFAFERDKLYGTDLDQVTTPFAQKDNERHWIIKLHDSFDKHYDDMYVSLFMYDENKDKLTWNFDSLKGFALPLTYTKADRYVKILSEYAKKNNLTFVPGIVDYSNEEPFTTLTTDEILEKAYSSQKQKLYRLHTNQTFYLIKDEDYEGFKSGESKEVRISLFSDENSFFIGEQHFVVQFDDWGPYIVINDVRYRPTEFSLVEDEELKETYGDHTKKAYDIRMSSKPKDHSKSEKQHTEDKKQEFNRSESLTFDETDKEEKWCKEHNGRYHRKNDEKKFKENPFHSGVSPVGRFVTVWQYCSISSWCECVCKDCYKKYKKAKKKLEKMSTCVQPYDTDYKKQKQKVDDLYEQAVFTVRDIDE